MQLHKKGNGLSITITTTKEGAVNKSEAKLK